MYFINDSVKQVVAERNRRADLQPNRRGHLPHGRGDVWRGGGGFGRLFVVFVSTAV
jgi:hypothetical protein